MKVKSLSRIQLFATPWTVAHQAPPSMEFSRQEYWSGLPLPSPGESSQPRDRSRVSHIARWFFTIWASRAYVCQNTEAPWKMASTWQFHGCEWRPTSFWIFFDLSQLLPFTSQPPRKWGRGVCSTEIEQGTSPNWRTSLERFFQISTSLEIFEGT